MKKLILLAFVTVASFSINAQIQAPAPSPFSKLEQKVGLTDVTVEYSRPSKKGREVFGNLVPFDKLWRTGANKNTIISFSDDVTVGGSTLKAGSYAVFTKPGNETWDVLFYSNTENWGTPRNWDESLVAAKATVKVYSLPMPVESFTVTIDDLNNNGASLGILWDKTMVNVPFTVPTDAKASKSIEKVMKGISANDYYAAASYYYEAGKDLKQAQEWINKAVSMNDKAFWMSRRQSLIYAKLGDNKNAIAAAKRSLASAKEQGNADYVKMNKDSLAEWGIEVE
ncbi:DUF2911 domain-containing protein [uncultured Maribacter sp.]|uniref:DUF2911 domain-containing protein n=1 Tax=uncultured Maribacter sp. TaxID=431308 RepID=UPI00262AF40E|nr:DUF2911 domain-containing protein [uncultured Maribacter sp.]